MENLIKRLQDEVGLNEEQAVKSVSVVKDFMDKEGIKIDWNKFFKGKYENLSNQAKSLFDKFSSKVDTFSDKAEDFAEDLAAKAKNTARDISKKIYDDLNEDK